MSGIRESLNQCSALLGKSVHTVNRQFRTRAAALGLTPEQRTLVSALTHGAAVKAASAGLTVRQYLTDASLAARQLALCDVDRDTVLTALREYFKLAEPYLKKEPAATNLLNALRLVVHTEFSAVREREFELLTALLDVEVHATDEATLAAPVLRELVRHFGATAAAWFREEEGALSVVAVRNVPDGVASPHTAAARTLRHRPRVLDPTDPLEAPAVLVTAWRKKQGSVWSVPAGKAILQIRFEHPRPMMMAENRMLRMVAGRITPAVERLDREARLRNISVRMLEVEELERRRIARELHDDAGQSLVVVRLQLELVEMSLPPDSNEARNSIAEVREITEKTILGVRRLISDLSPAVLEQLGLGAAIRQLANRFRGSYPAHVRLHLTNLPRLDPRLELVIYRVLQECFSNISRHSRAQRVNVWLTPSDRSLRLTVEDDGVGFRVEDGLGRRNCFGLLGIRQRVTLIGGRFLVQSTSVEQPVGTKVEVEIPLRGDFINSLDL